jgi:broad specificity phosphatase PhoE
LTDAVESGVLAGRRYAASLTQEGMNQAGRLAANLVDVKIDAVYCSPLERAVVTAEIISKTKGLYPVADGAFDEIDIGEWTGKKISDLTVEPGWAEYNELRSCTRPPGGETMIEVQQRAVSRIESLTTEHPNESVAVVSHADVIKAAIGYFAGIPIDLLARIEIDPASVSIVDIGVDFVTIKTLNAMSNFGGRNGSDSEP